MKNQLIGLLLAYILLFMVIGIWGNTRLSFSRDRSKIFIVNCPRAPINWQKDLYIGYPIPVPDSSLKDPDKLFHFSEPQIID